MADSFTSKQVLGVLGRFTPVLDYADVTLTSKNVLGVLGRFSPVLDEAATGGGGLSILPAAVSLGLTAVTPGVAPSGSVALAPAPQALTVAAVGPGVAAAGLVALAPVPTVLALTPVSPSVLAAGSVSLTPAALGLGLGIRTPVLTVGNAIIYYHTGMIWPPRLLVSPNDIICKEQPRLVRRSDGGYELIGDATVQGWPG